MDELKWMYDSARREAFQKKIIFAERLLEKYGAEYVSDFAEKVFWMLKIA